MAEKDKPRRRFRVNLTDDLTHKLLGTVKFTRWTLFLSALSAVVVILASAWCIFAYTPARNLIPGYPNSETRHLALRNAMLADSLKSAMFRWQLYSENLRKVLSGESPATADSLLSQVNPDSLSAAKIQYLRGRDSLLRAKVSEAEKAAASTPQTDVIDKTGFFQPVSGVITEPFDMATHPYILITCAPDSQIAAIAEGTVVQCGRLDDGGFFCTIQHGGSLLSTMHGPGRLLTQTGARVSSGSPVAVTAEAPGQHAAMITFAIWKNEEAKDPQAYIIF
mgnify:CR=1 FL=1